MLGDVLVQLAEPDWSDCLAGPLIGVAATATGRARNPPAERVTSNSGRVEKAHRLLAYAAHATTHVASLGTAVEGNPHLDAGLCVMPELGTARNQIRKSERNEETEESG
jgi:hypothetical protein